MSTFKVTTKMAMPLALKAWREAPPTIRAGILARISRYMINHRDEMPSVPALREEWKRDIIRQSVADEANDVPLPEWIDQASEDVEVTMMSSLQPGYRAKIMQNSGGGDD